MFTPADYAPEHYRSRATADLVMPMVLAFTGARSVLDIGCGVGAWLAVCAEQGITDYLGIDGGPAGEVLQIPRQHFRAADLREPLQLDRRYDVAISLETAEHLPAEVGPTLIAELTAAAPYVLFSAAIPGQRGNGHINERWPSYWAGLFAAHGYSPLDMIRPALWGREGIPYWYQQNILLYAHHDRVPENSRAPTMVDVVHPALLTRYVERLYEAEHRHISGKTAMRALATSVTNRLRRLIRR